MIKKKKKLLTGETFLFSGNIVPRPVLAPCFYGLDQSQERPNCFHSQRGIPPVFQNFCQVQLWRCKQSHLDWFGVKCSVLEKLAESELFTVVLIGTRRLKSLLPVKAPSKAFQLKTLPPPNTLITERYMQGIARQNTPQ